jgi:hypothetical protein
MAILRRTNQRPRAKALATGPISWTQEQVRGIAELTIWTSDEITGASVGYVLKMTFEEFDRLARYAYGEVPTWTFPKNTP